MADDTTDTEEGSTAEEGAEPTTEATQEGDDTHVKISEDFQKSAGELMSAASPEELHWLSSAALKMCYDAEKESSKSEEPTMSTDGMPAD